MSWFPVGAHALAQVLAPVPVLGDASLPAPTSHTVFQLNTLKFSSEENPPKAFDKVLSVAAVLLDSILLSKEKRGLMPKS
jgi:hypothetical protein